MPSKFEEFILSMVLPLLAKYGSESLAGLFNKLAVKNPEVYKTVVTSLYPPIDVHLEDLAKESKTKIDDPFVAGLKMGLEQSAFENGVELPNLDAGTPND